MVVGRLGTTNSVYHMYGKMQYKIEVGNFWQTLLKRWCSGARYSVISPYHDSPFLHKHFFEYLAMYYGIFDFSWY